MQPALAHRHWRILGRSALARAAGRWSLVAALAVSINGCRSVSPVDTKPLDDAGMTYDSIRELKAHNITALEVAQVAAARSAGVSDATCVVLLKIFHDRQQPFNAGDATAGLSQARVGEDTIVELARLNELGLPSGEFQAMRLAGLSDATVLAVARHRAANQPVLSGASLAGLKNIGVREATLLELARRGVPDSKAREIGYFRRRGGTDAEILGHFAGS